MNKLRIAIAAAECADLAAKGGVAEWVLGLAREELARGHDVRVLLPRYEFLESLLPADARAHDFTVRLGLGAARPGTAVELYLPGVTPDAPALTVYLIDGHDGFAACRSAAEIYAAHSPERWVGFGRAVVDFLDGHEWVPDILHCQDAHTAIIPVLLKQIRAADARSPLKRTRSVQTIHNLLEQLKLAPSIVEYAGMAASAFQEMHFEYWGEANCLKAGIRAADEVSTVSRRYAEEICSSRDFGFGLEGDLALLRDRGRLRGIINGIDESRWSVNGFDYQQEHAVDEMLRIKREARASLLADWGWEDHDALPVVSVRGRWDEGKGIRHIVEHAEEIAQSARLLVCAWSVNAASAAGQMWARLGQIAAAHPDRIVVNPPALAAVDDTATHYLVSELLLMPSLYEPCGLAQQECMRYGVLPVVSRTGGFADTVRDGESGFVFDRDDGDAMVRAVQRAVVTLADTNRWKGMVEIAIRQKNGWAQRFAEYEALYKSALCR
ncbi:MAG: hypothetical protein A3E25_12475 [Burkholderiales bacterium RIFCSPHIGHO2_12_FULL_69_20]|nr:MAG: hypothetical protein A3E25_12475 [Burkholderiales bacterium RIFCSPHIGHO2_12_FULL_69_20]